MKAAIYARKSNDDNDKHEDNKSVSRQVDRAKQYAAKKGWAVDEQHIFSDDGISGGEFLNRPGFKRMLEAAARSEFNVVITSEPSRLGRDMIRTSYYIAELLDANVAIYYYLTNEQERGDDSTQRLISVIRGFASEDHRARSAQRSRDALLRKAEQGYNTGGHCFGYDNVPVYKTNTRGEKVKSHTDYKINKEQAETVRGIFRMYADGHGHTTIAWCMNGNPEYTAKLRKYFGGKVPAPPCRGKSGTGSWSPTSIRSMLYNVRYTGCVPFGKTRSTYRKGTKARVRQAEFLLTERPDLRIIDEALWNKAQARLKEVAATYVREGGRWWGRPSTEKYLLSGLLKCDCCTKNIVVIGGKSGVPGKRKDTRFYGCSYHQNRGPAVCTNDHRVRMETVDERVIQQLEQTVLVPEAVLYVIEQAMAKAEVALKQNPERPKEIEAELTRLRRELNNFNQLIADGKAPKSLLVEMVAREDRIEVLEREQAELKQLPQGLTDISRARLRKGMQAQMERFAGLLRRDVPVARQALKKLLAAPLRCKPVVVHGQRTFAIDGKTVIGPLLPAEGYIGLALPRGFEPLLPA